MSVEVALLDHGIGPHSLHELFFDQHFSVVLDKRKQEVKVLRREGDGLVAAEQKALHRVYTEGAERIEAPLRDAFGNFRSFSIDACQAAWVTSRTRGEWSRF
jgi:hypothetical protein